MMPSGVRRFPAVFLLTLWLSLPSFAVQIIPKPDHLVLKSGSYPLSAETAFLHHPKLSGEAKWFSELLSTEYGISIKNRRSVIHRDSKALILDIDSSLIAELGSEGYLLDIGQAGIKIIGASGAGAFYGLQTLRQLLIQSDASRKGKKSYSIPFVEIRDRPRFSWRGFMLDVSRHFFDAEVVKTLLDEMALLKMNVFHWHLTDDQGWRIPIPNYPELISVASRRDSSQIELRETDGQKVFKFDGKPHQGYYTHDDIEAIVRYAAERHIKVIPEIDMPSHNQAAMAAYPWLGTTGKPSTVPTVFYGEPYAKNPAEIDISKPRVIRFFKEVLDEVAKLFPSDIIHIGGDEVWYNLWAESADINKFIETKGFHSYADLQMWFSTMMSEYLSTKGKRAMAWNDVLGGHLENPDSAHTLTVDFRPTRSTVVGFWRGNPKLIENAAKRGYDIVNGHNEFTYFNFGYQGLPLSKVYSFDPIPFDMPLKFKILGAACHLWTEHIPDRERLFFHLFPRIAAFAEICWTEPDNKHFDRFTKDLDVLKGHWKRAGINYAEE